MKKFVAVFTLASFLFASPLVSQAALGDQTLKQGMRNQDVQQLQQLLKKKGYFTGNTTTYFGPATSNAVKSFQRKNGLSADGVVGKSTYAKLGVKTSSQTSTFNASKVINKGKQYVGVPYRWGGTTPRGFDCSGFISYTFKQGAGITLPRTVAEIYKKGTRVTSLQPGDIVFFQTYQKGASHAGIYMGNNQFLHSSSSKGVSVASLKDSYWSKRYIGAKRIR
ncbi:NlpC/P60 family protein [Priestia sp. FSL W8-0001]|uniref:C40 family peptidase n=1 Tax=unclassified Priestia TaxID=2800374 RepID=UPI0030FC5F65